MKKIITIITLIFLITSCSGIDNITEKSKKDFLVEIKTFQDFSGETFLKKTGKLSSSQDIKLSSQIVGRVLNIFVKEGDYVKKGQILAKIEDNIGNYGINLERAQNGLNRVKINYDSTKINLDKAVFEADLNLNKLNKNLQALKDNTIENIRLAETDLNNSDYTNINSSSALELQKFDNTIKKTELDYQNKLIADTEVINSMYNSLKKEYSASMIFMDDIIKFSDEILGITEINKHKNDSFETYLGAKDTGQKDDTEAILRDLIKYRENDFQNIEINNINTNSGIINTLEILEISYNLSRNLLNGLETTINNSIESIGSLSSTKINTYITTINIYQATVQGNYTAFLGFDTKTKSFLRTYINNQSSILQSINLMKKDREILYKKLIIGGDKAEVGYNKTIITSNDSIDSLELQIKSLENTLENAKKTRDVTLRSLNNTITEAKISYTQALKEYNKLIIKSPISGLIGNIFIDIGQEIGIGTPIFTITNNTDNQITISFNKKELDFINEGSTAFLNFEGKSYTGSIYSISKIADQNLKYISKINILNNIDLIGNIVSIKIPIKTDKILLPINIIKINNSGVGTINILENNKIKQLDIKLGNIYGEQIEVIGGISENVEIIMNYVDNFDPEKFIIKIK